MKSQQHSTAVLCNFLTTCSLLYVAHLTFWTIMWIFTCPCILFLHAFLPSSWTDTDTRLGYLPDCPSPYLTLLPDHLRHLLSLALLQEEEEAQGSVQSREERCVFVFLCIACCTCVYDSVYTARCILILLSVCVCTVLCVVSMTVHILCT